jgi:hypothetical protein
VREVAPFALLACACTAAVTARPASPAPAGSTPPEPTAAGIASTMPAESYDTLAALGSSVAPGMHEVARKPGTGGGEPVELVRAESHDLCLRVAFDADAPLVTKLVDENGQVLASLAVPATHGVLAERGPVCIRKGDVVRAVAEGSGAHVRWMAWQSP